MGWLNGLLWGVKIWIWLYFSFSILGGLGVLIYFYRESIKRKYFELRFPEQLLKIVMHYKNNYQRIYYRLIPDEGYFVINSKQYNYSDKAVLKDNDFFVRKKDFKGDHVIIDGKEYKVDDLYCIKDRWKKYAEIHYFYNNPQPINFDLSKKSLEFNAKQLEEFKSNDLFRKLLTLEDEKRLLSLLLIIIIVNAMATFFILAKIMEWIK